MPKLTPIMVNLRDHSPVIIDQFNGLWQRGDIENTPIDHFTDCENIRFIGSSAFGTRYGLGVSQTVDAPLQNIKRIYNFPTPAGPTLIVLVKNDSDEGEIYHLIDNNTVYGPLLTIAAMDDFAFVPYNGRGYISPFANGLPVIVPPSIAPAAAVVAGAAIDSGTHEYAASFVTASGETTPSPIATVVTDQVGLATPLVAPFLTDLGAGSPGTANVLVAGGTYKWLFVFTLPNGTSFHTPAGPASSVFTAVSGHIIGMQATTVLPTGTYLVELYRTVNGGATYYREFTGSYYTNIATRGVDLSYGVVGMTLTDAQIVANPTAPVTNTTQTADVNLSSIPVGPSDFSITARKIYRTPANSSQLKLLYMLNDNTTTTYSDTTTDAGLGADAPTINTATYGTNQIPLGLPSDFVYVYEGDGTAARKAAGDGITGSLSIGSGSGQGDAGLHIFGIVTETRSGYLSPPGALTAFTTSGAGVSIGNIPTSGDPNVVARYIVSTIKIDTATYTGNLEGYEFFFVPGAVINNNTDTFLNNISFFDAALLEDASYLFDNFTEIPAGAVLSLYHNRMLVAATATDPSSAWLSAVGEPEAISQVDGLIIAPLDGNPISNAEELRDILYIFKPSRTFSYIDNGDVPSSWPLVIIDNGLGTQVHGIATNPDVGASSVDFLIIATYQGISLFNGRYVTPELSFKISAYWNALDRNEFDLIQMVNNPTDKEFYAVLPTGDILVGNYANGLDQMKIRWTPISFIMGVNTIAIININKIIIGAQLV